MDSMIKIEQLSHQELAGSPCRKVNSKLAVSKLMHATSLFFFAYLSVSLLSTNFGVMASGAVHLPTSNIAPPSMQKINNIKGSGATLNYWTVFSDVSTVSVVGPDNAYQSTFPVLTYSQSYWSVNFGGGNWLWDSYEVSNPGTSQTCVFSSGFLWNQESATISSAILNVASDNHMLLYINGNFVANCQCTATTACDGHSGSPLECDVTQYINGELNFENYFLFVVTNIGSSGSTPINNPAGLYFRVDFTYY